MSDPRRAADACPDMGGRLRSSVCTCSLLYPDMLSHVSSPYIFYFLFVLVLEFEPRISQIPKVWPATKATLAETKLLNGPPDVFLHICQSFLSGQSL